jgi:hypothetical protein
MTSDQGEAERYWQIFPATPAESVARGGTGVVRAAGTFGASPSLSYQASQQRLPHSSRSEYIFRDPRLYQRAQPF